LEKFRSTTKDNEESVWNAECDLALQAFRLRAASIEQKDIIHQMTSLKSTDEVLEK
jgi:hypothetical protein